MGHGLGKVQLAILEYLRAHIDEPSRGYAKKRLGPKGWRFASDIVYHVFNIGDYPDCPTRAQYISVYRAINRLSELGLIEKGYCTASYYGKKRGPWSMWEKISGEKGASPAGLVNALFVKAVSVD
jgi:hypothetical protein